MQARDMTTRKDKPAVLGVATRGFTHEIFLEGMVPPSANRYLRMHWAVKKKLRHGYSWAISMALLDQLKGQLDRFWRQPLPKMRVQVTVHSGGASVRRLDADNLWGGCKPLIDAMRDAGLIRNDSPKWIDLGVRENREPGRTGTRIEFEPFEAAR
jgi:hypothetical protein